MQSLGQVPENDFKLQVIAENCKSGSGISVPQW